MAVLTIPRNISGCASDTAKYVEREKDLGYSSLERSNVLGLTAKGVFQHLIDTFQECSIAGWDGERAQPITLDVLRYSCIFLDALPLGIEAPNISAEPDGSITLEWYSAPRRVLSVSIGLDGCLHYAALLGTSKRHGVEWIQDDISEDILGLINQVVQE